MLDINEIAELVSQKMRETGCNFWEARKDILGSMKITEEEYAEYSREIGRILGQRSAARRRQHQKGVSQRQMKLRFFSRH